ncbi:methylated-DNA--[protein]-cysteine S-methyltransferase [Listeria sp. PSOL-1]|uniref:methylated-DNA--[protein]-cysteine S-methyltransferase n=1 Tax=Listeria sp. PSOL-1 TaxID=1844999 RepID=UPI0013D444C3|nr:methylated-DNA--[protein]-cysteine S-methyltransferase [Listeria sp. PSOL-1]
MIYYGKINENNSYLAVLDEGLCFVSGEINGLSELKTWQEKHYPKEKLVENDEVTAPYEEWFTSYFSNQIPQQDIPLTLTGTPFQQKVWEILKSIPYGEKRTYSEVAEELGNKRAVRAVAKAIGANPVLIVIPCHRVIGKSGKLTGYRAGLAMKEKLLEIESS